MDVVKRSEEWRDTHQDSKVILGLRIVLGLLLLYKGIYFLAHGNEIWEVMDESRFGFGSMLIAHFIGLLNLAGGLMIAIGFLTRVSALLNIPILIGAVLFANVSHSVFSVYSELLLSIVVLLMLVFFLFYGAGIFSMDVFLRRKRFYE